MHIRHFVFLTMIALSGAAAAADKPASGGLAIAAVVGKDIISSYDVANRIKFILTTTKLTNSPDVLERIRPQVIRSLIDEKLQMQEAEKNGIAISDADVEKAIAAIEAERGMPAGAIFKMLEEGSVPKQTFQNQIRAQLAWNKLLAKNVRSHVKVSDEEVKLMSKKILTPTTAKELQIAVISLPVDKPSAEGEVRRLGEKLVGEVRAGASFEEVSRQFGASAGGGRPATFWVRPEQLDPAVGRALAGAKAGTITDPVRTDLGFTIVKVYDAHAVTEDATKEIEVVLKEILLKLKPDADNKEADVMIQIGEEVAKHPGSCEDKTIANIDNLKDFDIDVEFNHTTLSELPPAVKIIAENLKVGDISSPFASNEGIRLYMLCDKKEAVPVQFDKERVANIVFQQKMELEAQKYMRNLRRDAFIEVR